MKLELSLTTTSPDLTLRIVKNYAAREYRLLSQKSRENIAQTLKMSKRNEIYSCSAISDSLFLFLECSSSEYKFKRYNPNQAELQKIKELGI